MPGRKSLRIGYCPAQHGQLHVHQREIRVPLGQHAQAVGSLTSLVSFFLAAGLLCSRLLARAGRNSATSFNRCGVK